MFNNNQVYQNIIRNNSHVSDDKIEVETSANPQYNTNVSGNKVEALTIPQIDDTYTTLTIDAEVVDVPLFERTDLTTYKLARDRQKRCISPP